MNIKLFINKFVFLLNKNKKYFLQLVILLLIYHIYLENIVWWYGAKYEIIANENTTPNPVHLPEYILLAFPAFVTFIISTSFITSKTKFLQCIIFPILFCSYIYASIPCVLILGGGYVWLYILLFPIFLVIFFILCLIGLIKDIKTIKNTEL